MVVDAVKDQLMSDPLASIGQLREVTNKVLDRNDLSDANITAALDQIPSSFLIVICVNRHACRVSIKREIQKGGARYKEEALLSQMLNELSEIKAKRAGITDKQESEMSITDPTAIKALVTPDFPQKEIPSKLKLLTFCLSLYYSAGVAVSNFPWGVPLSRLGQWLGCHKTTVLRNLMGLSLSLWPICERWIIKNTKASVVYIDEKWLKIKGKWHYWFVVLDKETGLPVLSSLHGRQRAASARFGSITISAVKFIALKLRAAGKVPKVIITDGLLAYKNMFQGVVHQSCIFHHQQGVFRFFKERSYTEEEMKKPKKEMKKLFQTNDKRTVKRRLSKLEKEADALGITNWVWQTKQNLKKLISAVGSRRIPRTNNAIERFFRQFNRFYKTRCGFFSIKSARNQLILFLLVYLFTLSAETQKAPIEAILPQAKNMPLYQILNDPLRVLFDDDDVKIADFSAKECLVA